MAYVPPWLNVNPQSFAAAQGRGLAIGEQAAASRMRLAGELASIAARSAAEKQAADLEKQRIAKTEQLSEMEMNARQEQQKREFLLNQARNQTLNAYRQASLGLRKQAIDEQAASGAQKLGAQMKFLADVKNGVDAGMTYDEAARRALLSNPHMLGAGAVTSLLHHPGMTPADKFQLGEISREMASRRSMMEDTSDLEKQADAILSKYKEGVQATQSPAPETGGGGNIVGSYDPTTGTFTGTAATTNAEPQIAY